MASGLERVLALSANDELDEFLVGEFIGQGKSGLAKLYGAGDGVLKLFVDDMNESSMRYEKFKNEASMLKRFAASSNILDTLTDFREEGLHNKVKKIAPYYVTERMDGDLEKLILQVDLTLPQKLEMMRQILSGARDCHKQGVGHRDLYTPNVLFKAQSDGTYVLKIADFGSAKDHKKAQRTPYFIPTGIKIFTSPESAVGLLGGDKVDPALLCASDVYSLGLMFYELLTSRRQEWVNAMSAGIVDAAHSAGMYNLATTMLQREAFLNNFAIPALKQATVDEITAAAILSTEEVAAELDEIMKGMIEPDYRKRMCDLDAIDQRLERLVTNMEVKSE
jgi:serine/threonine protein kinase